MGFKPVSQATQTSLIVPEVYTDPVSPQLNQSWYLITGVVGAGSAMGTLGMTYTMTSFDECLYSYMTSTGRIVRVALT